MTSATSFQLLTYAPAVTHLTGASAGRTGVVFLLDKPDEPACFDASSRALADLGARIEDETVPLLAGMQISSGRGGENSPGRLP